MKDTSAIHDAGHSLGLWLFSGNSAWFEFVLHIVLLAAPFALALVLGAWLLQLARHIARRHRERAGNEASASVSEANVLDVFRYVFKHTRRSQFLLLCSALLVLPLLYAGLELPKLIINNAISSGHFPIEIYNLALSQTDYLYLLSGLYLIVILINGTLKYQINVHKGGVAESLLRRLRLTIYRHWRRNTGQEGRTEVIPMLVQEVEPIGGFAGDAFVLPVFQGGTFLTILAFMFAQDPVLGAAAITLLPVQLALIPRLQRKINHLVRRRAQEMRGLGGVIGREIASDAPEAQDSRRRVAGALRGLAAIRLEIYKKKFFVKGLNNFITQLTPFFFYTVGGYLVIEGRLSFGALVAVLAAHKDFSAPLKELLKYYQTMEDVRVRFDETRRFLSARAHQAQAHPDAANPSRQTGRPSDPNQQPAVGSSAAMETIGTRFQPCAPESYPP